MSGLLRLTAIALESTVFGAATTRAFVDVATGTAVGCELPLATEALVAGIDDFAALISVAERPASIPEVPTLALGGT